MLLTFNLALTQYGECALYPLSDGRGPDKLCGLAQLHSAFVCVYKYEPRSENINALVSDLVRHKPGCTATYDG